MTEAQFDSRNKGYKNRDASWIALPNKETLRRINDFRDQELVALGIAIPSLLPTIFGIAMMKHQDILHIQNQLNAIGFDLHKTGAAFTTLGILGSLLGTLFYLGTRTNRINRQ